MELALLTGEVGSGKTLLTRALVDRRGRPLRGGDDPEPPPAPRGSSCARWPRSSGSREPRFHVHELLDQIHERLLELDEAGPARAPDRGRGAPDPRQGHLRGDPPPHELPARRPQPDRGGAGRPAGAARAARSTAPTGRSPSGSAPQFHLAPLDRRGHRAPTCATGSAVAGAARPTSSPTEAVRAPPPGLGRASRGC